MNKKLTIYSIVATILLQFLTIASGFIIPKLVLTYFGSSVNGMVASVTQFLNYIQLLEGGVSAVAMAALYKPLAANDEQKVSSIVKATSSFFKTIGLIYIVYAISVALIYPAVISTPLDYYQSVLLILIIASGIFVQYFFSLTYRVLINADRRGYVVSLAQCALITINLAIAILTVEIYPSIHLLKVGTLIAYLTQPLLFAIYVKKHYKINKNVEPDKDSLKQKWDAFGHNLAYFVHANTDIIVLTIFSSLARVSVYAVYASITTAIRTLIIAISAAIKPSFGNVLVSSDANHTNKVFDYYELGINYVSSVLFSCCFILIVPFVTIYTNGITDVNYYEPVFAILLCAGELVYCIRDPFVSAAYAANMFKKTAVFAYIETALNIIVSLSLVYFYGLVGVAIGTLVAMVFRMVAQAIFLRNNILFRPIQKWFKGLICVALSVVCCFCFIFFVVRITPTDYFTWFVYALISFFISAVLTATVFFGLNSKTVIHFFKLYFLKR